MGLLVWRNRCISTPYEIAFVKNAELGSRGAKEDLDNRIKSRSRVLAAGAVALAVDQHGKRKVEQGKREVAEYKRKDEQRKHKIAERNLAAEQTKRKAEQRKRKAAERSLADEQAKRKAAQNSAKYYEARLKEIEPQYEFLSIWFPKHVPHMQEYAAEIKRLRAELAEARKWAA